LSFRHCGLLQNLHGAAHFSVTLHAAGCKVPLLERLVALFFDLVQAHFGAVVAVSVSTMNILSFDS